MPKKNISVLAVIPAHNSAKTLPRLIDELIRQNYDDIFVVDDASTDNTVKLLMKKYRNKVKIIEGVENVGSGANRNRIIGRVNDSIIHFIDADMVLLSKDTPGLIRSIKWPDDVAYIGGVVRDTSGRQYPYNYGPRPHILTVFQGFIQFFIWTVGKLSIRVAGFLRTLCSPLLRGFPNIYVSPRKRHAYWVAESNMIVRSDFFAEHGGFDPRFRYSEIEDLSLRMHQKGKHGYFVPEIDAMHLGNDNVLRSVGKRYEAHKQFIDKHGRLARYLPFLSDYLGTRKTQKRYHK